MKEAFEKMTGMPDAWTNLALMVSRNAFIQGWEAALAQQAQQEPTGMLHIDRLDKWLDASLKKRKAQRTWVDLTEDEMDKVRQSMFYNEFMSAGEYAKLVQIATQTKLKEKNNGLL